MSRFTHTATVLSCSFALVLTSPFAEEVSQELPTIVVTATRTAHTVDQTLTPVTVLTQDDITQSGALTVPDLLKQVPGVDFSSSGGLGHLTGMSLRGTNTNHVLLLIDGIPMSSATTGAPSWEYLQLAAADRIEVVRGPGSSLYGSSAIGGIVQIMTPRGEGPAQPEASLQMGSHSTYQATTGVAGSSGDTHYHLGVGELYTAGIDPMDHSVLHTPYTGGYRNTSVQVRLDQTFGMGEVDFHLLRASGRSGYDNYPFPATTPTPPTDETFVQQVVGVDLNLSPRDSWKTRLTLGESSDDRDDSTAGGAPYYFHTRRDYTAWQNDWVLSPNHLLTAGVDYQQEHLGSDTHFTSSSRGNSGVFLQDQISFGRHDLVMGGRHDDNDAFGTHNTGNITYGLHLTPTLRLTAAWGSAFRSPTFNELYYPGYSNPNLRPETSHSKDIGLKGIADWGKWELHAFRTDIDHLIALNALYLPFNLDRARIDGAEIYASTQVDGWELSSTLNVLNPRDRDTNRILPRRARNTLQLGIARSFGEVRTMLTVLSQSGRYNDSTNTTYLPGYTLVGLRVTYPMDRHWSLEGRMDNLLDAHYETAVPYRSPGCTMLVGVRYTPH